MSLTLQVFGYKPFQVIIISALYDLMKKKSHYNSSSGYHEYLYKMS